MPAGHDTSCDLHEEINKINLTSARIRIRSNHHERRDIVQTRSKTLLALSAGQDKRCESKSKQITNIPVPKQIVESVQWGLHISWGTNLL